MKRLTLLTLLVIIAPFCFGEKWVCELKTYRDGKETTSRLVSVRSA